MTLDLLRITEEMLPVLSIISLTQAILDDLLSELDLFESAVDAVRDARDARKQMTPIRLAKVNKLYSLVAK